MAYPQTRTRISEAANGSNQTRTALSTNIIVQVNGQPVGAVQTFSVDESRQIKMIDELGTDGHVDSTPVKSADFKGNCERIRFDRLRVAEAMGRGYVHINSQRIPFDFTIIDTWQGESKNIITTVKNVWLTGISYSYNVGDWTIIERANWEAETIYSTLNDGNAATGGNGFINIQKDSIEQEADRGGRRGGLDAPGLINAFFST